MRGCCYAVLCCAAALACWTRPAAAQAPSFEQIARTGDPAPGRSQPTVAFRGRSRQSNDVVGVFSEPCINAAGEVVFRGESAASNGTLPANGLYYRLPGQGLAVLADTTRDANNVPMFTVPGLPAGTCFTDFRPPLLNAAGDVVFKAYFLLPGDGIQSGIFAASVRGGALVNLADSVTTNVPGLTGQTFNRGFGYGSTFNTSVPICLNDAGQVVFRGDFKRASVSWQELGYYSTTVAGGALVRLVDTTGTQYPVDEPSWRVFNGLADYLQPALSNAGQVVFTASLYGPVRGVYAVPVNGGAIRTLAREGRAATTLLSDGLSRYYGPTFEGYDLNDDGTFVLHHAFGANTAADKKAIFHGTLAGGVQGVVVDNAGGYALPGLPGTLAYFGRPLINAGGTVSFFAQDSAGLQGNYVAPPGDAIQLVALKAATPPERGPDVQFTNFEFDSAPINAAGNVALAPLAYDYAAARAAYGCWLFSACAGTLGRVVDDLASSPPPPAGLGGDFTGSCTDCVKFIKIWDNFETRAGHMRSLNEANQVGLLAAFNTFEAGVYVATVAAGGGPPTITCPPDALLECPAALDPEVTGYALAEDTCSHAALPVTFSDALTAGCGGSAVIARTWTATDATGRSASCTQQIALQDTTAPALVVPLDVTVACGAPIDPEQTGQATATDACDAAPAVTWTDEAGPGACPVIVRTWRAQDACGNSAQGVQTITVVDSVPPEFTLVPQDQTVECDGLGNVDALNAWLAAPVAIDDCGDVTLTSDYAGLVPTCGGAGSVTVTWTATDACGNSAAASATFTVQDTVPPVLEAPADIVVDLPPEMCAAAGLNLGQPVVSDTCGPAIVVSDAPLEFPPGTTVVTWTALDACGLSTVRTQQVVVVDATAPFVTCAVDEAMLWPPNHKWVTVGLVATVDDFCSSGLPPVVTVYADEDDEEDTGDGVFAPDAIDIAPGTLRLRAERKGNANGRVYLIVVEALDLYGNVGRATCAVVVPHSRSKASLQSVTAQAQAARQYFDTYGVPPPGFYPVGE